jgi:hypothetical protein
MRKSPLTTFLLVVLVVSTLISVALCFFHISSTRQLRVLQAQAQMVNNNRAFVASLAAEMVEYSKKNPAIIPVLEASGLGSKPAAPAPAAPAPSVKPAGK